MSKNALCIGINDYPGTQNDLAGCVNDANDWAAELGGRGFAVTKMLDQQATHAAMTAAINGLIQGAASGDTLVITYSGHGTWVPDSSGDEPDGRDEALCPWDIGQAGPLLDDQIRQMFLARPAGVRILLLSDSCHSGSVTRGDDEDLDSAHPRARFMPLESWMPGNELPAASARPAHRVGGLKRSGGDLLLAGCLDTQFSWDTSFKGRPNGAFTYYAIKTLRESKPANYDAWFKAIRAYLPSSKLPQEPQILGSAGARRFKVFT
ncbi:caspase family protein [Propionivibrio sp.]|uniref:caspase family protein n=1 Tax=Propionivibrio sp. TaxID=2212460 RepID=UPI0026317AD3|nr:caspase family protein [Propionivibrio sp.]